MKNLIVASFLFSFLFGASVYAGEYTQNLKRDYARGFENMTTAPLEIPATIGKYHKEEKTPIVREARGLVDGLTRVVDRFGSGAWDWLAGLVPGDQEGQPMTPETLDLGRTK